MKSANQPLSNVEADWETFDLSQPAPPPCLGEHEFEPIKIYATTQLSANVEVMAEVCLNCRKHRAPKGFFSRISPAEIKAEADVVPIRRKSDAA